MVHRQNQLIAHPYYKPGATNISHTIYSHYLWCKDTVLNRTKHQHTLTELHVPQ